MRAQGRRPAARTWAQAPRLQEHENEARCLSSQPVALLVASVTDSHTCSRDGHGRKPGADTASVGQLPPRTWHRAEQEAAAWLCCHRELAAPPTATPRPCRARRTPLPEGRLPAPLRPCPEPPSPPCPQGATHPSAAGRRRTARPPGSSAPTLCTPGWGLRTRLKECTERSPGLCRPRAESEGPTSFRGRWTRAPGRGCWERRPRRGSRGGGAERGWEACEAAPSGTQPGPLEGTPAALTDERLQALARGRVPDPTAKRHRTHTVRTRCSQQHTPRLAFPPPRPPPL